jgi:hypothetical protein
MEEESFTLGDIGDYKNIEDAVPIASASLVCLTIALTLARFASLGGYSLNSLVDNFGLEAVLAHTSFVLIIAQLARLAFTMMGRDWSPFVFVCVLLAVQIVHDLIFYYGPLTISGKNDMIDGLKRYVDENGSRVLTGHSVFFIFVAVVAMFFKENTMLTFLSGVVALYLIPFVITTVGPKKPVPKEAPPKKATWERPG